MSGLTPNGSKPRRGFYTYSAAFPCQATRQDFEAWAEKFYPHLVLFSYRVMSDDCGNDDNGGKLTSEDVSYYEVVLADPVAAGQFDQIATGVEGEVITVREATRRFWAACGFDGMMARNGAYLIDVLLEHQVRPIELTFVDDTKLASILGPFSGNTDALIKGFREALTS